MILNTRIWQATIEAAKSAAASSPAWLRAIDRAVIEIEKASYWAFDGSTLAIISTTSKKLYKIDDGHTCEARGGVCKHLAARRLMQRYTERLATAPAPAPAKSTDSPRPTAGGERGALIADIKATWSRKYPGDHLADALMARFRCNNLTMLATGWLRDIRAAL